MDDRAVDLTGGNQNNVPGPKLVGCTFDIITETAAFKNQQLVKVVVMALEIPRFCVGQIEDAEIAVQVTCFVWGHGISPWTVCVREEAVAFYKAASRCIINHYINKSEI